VGNRSSASPGSSSSIFFAKGQRWRIGVRLIQIGHVGRLLVHYRTIDPVMKRRSPESLLAIKTLQQFLKQNQAVLLSTA
jgi:hypothetical protein